MMFVASRARHAVSASARGARMSVAFVHSHCPKCGCGFTGSQKPGDVCGLEPFDEEHRRQLGIEGETCDGVVIAGHPFDNPETVKRMVELDEASA